MAEPEAATKGKNAPNTGFEVPLLLDMFSSKLRSHLYEQIQFHRIPYAGKIRK